MNRTRSIVLPALAALGALWFAASLGAWPSATGELRLAGEIRTQYRFDRAACPAGTPLDVSCVRFIGRGEIPGLGRVTTTYTKTLPNGNAECPVVNHNEALIEIAGKGTIAVARTGTFCGPTAPAQVPPSEFRVTGGSGLYAQASGTLVFASSVYAADLGCGPCGSGLDTWTGTLAVPGVDFDVTPPVLAGATSRTARIARGAKRIRVRYQVTASDVVDGRVTASCTPRSGSWFRHGRTVVTCTASDLSANTASARFTVTVKRTAS